MTQKVLSWVKTHRNSHRALSEAIGEEIHTAWQNQELKATYLTEGEGEGRLWQNYNQQAVTRSLVLDVRYSGEG